MPMQRILSPHRILLTQQHILQTFRGSFLECIITQNTSCKHGHQECSCPFKGTQFGPPTTLVGRNDLSKPIGSNTKFKFGQFKGKTFWEILHDHPDYFVWTQKNAKSPGASEYAEWVNQNFEYRGNAVYRRSSLEPPPPLPKQHTRLRKPPYPPKEKCVTCTQFTRQGKIGRAHV